jgi:hypothetical protein
MKRHEKACNCQECLQYEIAELELAEKTRLAALMDELEYLRWFRQNADFGPGDGGYAQDWYNERYMKETGKKLPKGWNYNSSGEEI